MRRMVVVGLVGGALVVTAVVVSRRRSSAITAAPSPQLPDWAPLRLVDPLRLVEPLSPAPPAASAAAPWVDPAADGSCPTTHPVKAKLSSGIYHQPGGRFYDVTRAQRCYADPGGAEADGLRPSQR